MKPPVNTVVNVVILAAGLGTRMKSKHAKVLHRAGGLTLIEHVVHAASGITSAEHITVVIGHQAEQVKQRLAGAGVGFVEQSEQKGTGHAVMACRDALESQDGLVVVLYGDCPLLSKDTLRELVDRQASGGSAVTLITTRLEDPTGYGRMLLGETGEVLAIVEQKAATAEQRGHPIGQPRYLLFSRGSVVEAHRRNPARQSGARILFDRHGGDPEQGGHIDRPHSRSPMPGNCWESIRAWSWPRWTRFFATARCGS